MRIDEITLFGPSDAKIIATIEQKCGKYIAEQGGIKNAIYHHPLYRGIYPKLPMFKHFVEMPVKQNRGPLNSSMDVHVFANEWFANHSQYGIKYRSQSLFCTGNLHEAAHYTVAGQGQVVIVLPVGDYHYCWSPEIMDLFGAFDLRRGDGGVTSRESVMDNADYREDRDLLEAIDSFNEIMLHCKTALFLSLKKAESLMEIL